MNATYPEFKDTPAYAARWIVGYVLLAVLAFHIASVPAPAADLAARNPSSWANR